MFTESLVEIEYTLNVHPLTRVTYPLTLKRDLQMRRNELTFK